MISYRIHIDREACVGDRACCEIAPDTFELDDEKKSVVINPQGDPPEDILAAARNCRLAGITLYDASTGERVWPQA